MVRRVRAPVSRACGLLVAALFSQALAAQSTESCPITTETVRLEAARPAKPSFTYRWTGYTVFMAPADAIAYWRSEVYSGSGVAEILEAELPLSRDRDVLEVLDVRIAKIMLADLMHAGMAVMIPDHGVPIASLEVRTKTGPPCNDSREFFVTDANGNLVRVANFTDWYR